MKNNETLTLYYNANNHVGKKTLAYAHTLTDHVLDLDVTRENITATQWLALFQKLNTHPKDIMDLNSDVYKNKYEGQDFDLQTWVEILQREPELVHYPIAERGEIAVICKINQDINQLGDLISQDRHR
jgi:arsenate reductase-like glutaredoxin family protein